MKRKSLISVLVVVVLMISLVVVGTNRTSEKFTMPDNVKGVVEKSCFSCHTSSAKNKMSKMKLNFDKMDKLSTIKMISAYTKIGEEVEKDKMPPEKYLNKFPDKKLTEDEKNLLINWTKNEAEALVKSK